MDRGSSQSSETDQAPGAAADGPPPCYEEAATNPIYMPHKHEGDATQQEEPPPSYESVSDHEEDLTPNGTHNISAGRNEDSSVKCQTVQSSVQSTEHRTHLNQTRNPGHRHDHTAHTDHRTHVNQTRSHGNTSLGSDPPSYDTALRQDFHTLTTISESDSEEDENS